MIFLFQIMYEAYNRQVIINKNKNNIVLTKITLQY